MAQPRHHLTAADGRQRGHLREVGAEDGPRQSDVAAELYQTRLRRGIELDHAAGELRMHYEQLLAIEEGRFDDLPGPAYVIGFLRSYAAYLDLDADEMVRRFKAETADFDARQDLAFPSPHDEGRVPTGAIIVLGLALVGAAYAGWYYVSNVNRVAIERIPEVPERLVAELPAESEALAIDTIVASIPESAVAAADEPAAEHEARAAITPVDGPAAPEDAGLVAAEPEAEPEPEFEAVAVIPAEPGNPEPASVEPAVEPTVEPIVSGPAETPEADVAALAVPEPEAVEPEVIEPELAEPEPEPELGVAALAVPEPEAVEPEVIEPELAEPEPEIAEPEAVEPEIAEPEPEPAAPAIEKQAIPEPAAAEPQPAEPQQPEPRQTASAVPEIPAPVVESTDYAPREFGRANSGSTIRLRARLETWVQVTGANNELLLTRILRPGDIYHVPDRPGLVLMTGNAGGLEVLVGDVVAPTLGPVGKIQRRVALDPERLLAGTAID